MNQRRFFHILENLGKPQDAVLMWCAAAFERRINMGQAKPRRFGSAERIGAAIGAIAAQIDDGADAMTPRCLAHLPG